jgi:diguanylate cyclase (GGDEF)-like protein
MQSYQEEYLASNISELLSTTNTWLLVRHQWLIDSMRSVLTGEHPPPLNNLLEFDKTLPKRLKLSEGLIKNFNEFQSSLETPWLEATKAIHPMSGRTVFEQIDNYQLLAHRFLRASKEANQKLLHDFTMRDSLTGAWSRLTLNASLSQALTHTTQFQSPSCIAFLDQDKFKSINDQWGHVVGDQVLTKSAEIIHNSLRPYDKLFRFGGDEWLILMPFTSRELANNVLERIKSACQAHVFKPNNDNTFHASFSYGIAESKNNLTPKDWVMQADKQLYAKKLLEKTN